MENTKKSNRKVVGNLLFLFVVLVVLIILLFSLNDINVIWDIITDSSVPLLVLALVLSLVHMFLTNSSIHLIASSLGSSIRYKDSMNIANTEYLFNAITPFASGGQPIQAYYFMKKGLTGDQTMSVITSNFIVYQAVSTVLATLGIIVFFSDVKEGISGYVWLIFLGYVINTLILLGAILMSSVKGFRNFLRTIFRGLGKIKFLNKSMTNLEKKSFEFVERFQVETKKLFKRKRVLFGASGLRLLSLLVVNSIPIVVFLALGVTIAPKDYLFILMMTAFATTFMIWIPTPGASGGVEWAFTVLFTGVIASQPMVIAAMLIWRVLTYYVGIISGFCSYVYIRKDRV